MLIEDNTLIMYLSWQQSHIWTNHFDMRCQTYVYIIDQCEQNLLFFYITVFHPRLRLISGPFQSLKILDTLNRCNVSRIAHASISIFPFFLPFRCEVHSKKFFPFSSYTFLLSSRERITQISARNVWQMSNILRGSHIYFTLHYKIFLFDLCEILYFI